MMAILKIENFGFLSLYTLVGTINLFLDEC